MKTALVLALAGFAVAAEAADTKTTCIDPSHSYLARSLNDHDVYVESTMGRKKPPLRLVTSCRHLEPATAFGLSAEFQCIGQGDTIVANLIGDRQSCRITKIVPYAPQKDDLPGKTE